MYQGKKFTKKYLLFILIYALLTIIFFWIIKDDWSRTAVLTDSVNKDALLPELSEGNVICQEIRIVSDRPEVLMLYTNLQPDAPSTGNISVSITNQAQALYDTQISYSEIDCDGILRIPVDSVSFLERNQEINLILRAEGGISFWYGSSKAAGKFLVNVETSDLRFNDEEINGELVYIQRGLCYLPYMRIFWPVMVALFIIISSIILYCHYCRRENRKNVINEGLDLIKQYKYLLKTLVVRDFKIKYKASVLGVLWSFLNPLLMTFVYMFVFSTIFTSSIDNFVIYLMSGIILFNYLSESSNLGMQSIVSNAGLITKVYMPKYILPISKVLSSGINLAISLIPLLIMMAITGVRFSKSLLLIPVVLLLLILFCVGVSLILSSAIVFFRDVQFLWGIFLTVLNFLSPIFYPESIIPARFITLYHMNPMYQYLFFMRTIILGGISPTPVTYLYCILASVGTLCVGLFIFRKCQSQFVFHL